MSFITSFKTIQCIETYLKFYSHYPENAADSHPVFTFSSSSSLFPVQVPFWRYRCASPAMFFSPLSSVSSELWLCIEVIHPLEFCIDKARKRGCIEHRVVNNNFRNALTMHYNFWGYFTSSINLFYERWIYCFATYSHRGSASAVWVRIARNAMRTWCFVRKSRGGRLQYMWPIHGIPTICLVLKRDVRVNAKRIKPISE